MSPMSRASKVNALRKGMGTAVSDSGKSSPPGGEFLPPASTTPKPPKPARITLNLPPQLYRDLQRWCDTTADVLDVPRVGVQEALRGFIREITTNPAVSAKMIASVKDEVGR